MAVNPFFLNAFGQNVAQAGSGPIPQGIMPGEHDWMKRLPGGVMAPSPTTGRGLFGLQNPEQRDMLLSLGANLLAGSGYSKQPRTTGEILGSAMLAAQQSRAMQQEREQKRRLQEAQIAEIERQAKNPGELEIVIGPDGKPRYAARTEAVGQEAYQRPGSVAEAPASIQEYQLYTQQAAAAGQQPIPFEQWLRQKAAMTPINPSVVNMGPVPYVVQPTRGGAPVVTQIGDPSKIAADTATVEQQKQQAAEEGKATGQRAATFNSDLARIDDEVERTERLLAEFRAGRYQTGPIAGRLPNVRTSAQELSREQGKDVIGAISSATFGALSEGEREFLRNIGISETATEEANISLLEQRKKELTRARDRLRQQGLAGNYGDAKASGAKPPADRVKSLLDKYAPK
jgi:hypothetical protein